MFDYVIEIAIRPHKECCGQSPLFLEFAPRYIRGGIAIKRDLLRDAPFLDRLRKETLSRGNIAVFT